MTGVVSMGTLLGRGRPVAGPSNKHRTKRSDLLSTVSNQLLPTDDNFRGARRAGPAGSRPGRAPGRSGREPTRQSPPYLSPNGSSFPWLSAR